MMCFNCPYVGCTRKGHIARHFRENGDHRLSPNLREYLIDCRH